MPDGRVLVDVAPAKLPAGVEGTATDHPATGAPASWVPASAVARLPASGLTMLDGPAAIAARFDAALRAAAPELVGLDETQRLLDGAAREHPALVRALVPARADLPLVADVLRRLVAEGVGLRDLTTVLEALARAVGDTRDPAALTERVRAQLQRLITHRFTVAAAGARHVSALLLDADAEEAVRGALRPAGDGVVLALEPDLADALLASVDAEAQAHKSPVILTSPELRRHVRRLVEGEHPRLPVLAYQELLERRRGGAGGHHPYYRVEYRCRPSDVTVPATVAREVPMLPQNASQPLNAGTFSPAQVAAEQAAFMRKVFAIMALGLGATGLTALVVVQLGRRHAASSSARPASTSASSSPSW